MARVFTLLMVVYLLASCAPPAPAPRPSGAYSALSWWSTMRAYPDADVPGSGLSEAFAAKQAAAAKSSAMGAAEPWEAVGPHNFAGRMLSVAFNPQRSTTLLAGSASGGLWRSYSAGEGAAAWHRIETGFPILSVSTIAYAAGDSMTIFLGTGEVYNRADRDGRGVTHRPTRGSYGLGIFVSRDGGASWQKSLDWSAAQGRGVQMIRVNSLRPSSIWAATTEGLLLSHNSGATWRTSNSVVMATDVAFHPADTSRVYAAHGNLGSPGRGLYRSSDAGATWERLTRGLPPTFGGKAMIAIAPSDPAILYASIGNGYRSSDGNWLVRSQDGGDSWETTQRANYVGSQGWYSHDVSVHPEDPDRITVVGFLIHRSTNSGRSLIPATAWDGWTRAAPPIGGPDGPSSYTHPDHHAIAVHPDDPDYQLYATDGGIYRTLDGGQTFRALNGGLQTIQFYPGMSNSLHESVTAMAGTQDNSTLLFRGRLDWRILGGGDGAWTAIDPVDPARFYWSSQFLAIRSSTNRGVDGQSVAPPESNRATGFVAPYVLSLADPERLYAGRDRVYVSRNRGGSWAVGNGGLPLTGEPMVSMATSETDPDVIYAITAPGADRGRVFASTDAARSWLDITDGLPDRYLVDLAVDGRNHRRLFVAVAGFGSAHLFGSEDGGETWRPAAQGLPDLPTWSVAIDPDIPEQIYVGNDIGVFISVDSGETFSPFSQGLPEAIIAMDLGISRIERKLRVATHGNGMFQRQLDGSTSFAPPTAVARNFALLTVFPNPASVSITATYVLPARSQTHLGVYDSVGRMVRLVVEGGEQPGRIYHSVDVTGLPPGVYYLRLVSPAATATTSFTVVR